MSGANVNMDVQEQVTYVCRLIELYQDKCEARSISNNNNDYDDIKSSDYWSIGNIHRFGLSSFDIRLRYWTQTMPKYCRATRQWWWCWPSVVVDYNVQTNCFQLVLMSDSSRGRSYFMFIYNYIGWDASKTRPATQGFQSETSFGAGVSTSGRSTSVVHFYTSFRQTAYMLSTISGNYGTFGVRRFGNLNRKKLICVVEQTASSKTPIYHYVDLKAYVGLCPTTRPT